MIRCVDVPHFENDLPHFHNKPDRVFHMAAIFSAYAPAQPSETNTMPVGRGTALVGMKAMAEEGMRVLLVDDERDICHLLSAMLGRSGMQCTSANSLAEARSRLNEGTFAVVFLDIYLPDGRGYSLADEIRSSGARVIAMSAVDHEREEALSRGVDLFIAKPFDRSTIFGGLRTLGLIQ